ncbi:MAG: hypothetical protein ACREQA_06680 [Candidatus Binatia bacterium]
MFKLKPIACLIVWGLALAMLPLHGFGQEKIEGTVISTNLTSCSVVPGKVGTCEGTLVLESKGDGKPRQMTVKITRDTMLKKGEEKLFLFQLQGASVIVTLQPEKGEKVAQTVVMKP